MASIFDTKRVTEYYSGFEMHGTIRPRTLPSEWSANVNGVKIERTSKQRLKDAIKSELNKCS